MPDALEPDGLIVGNTNTLSPGPFEQVLDIGIAFQTRDKENGVGGQVAVPAVIGEAAINADKGPFGEFQRPGPVDLVLLAPGHVHEDWQVTVGIQTDMQFDGSLFLPEFGPGKGGETKIDHRGIKQVELAFEREAVFGCYQLAPVQQPGKQALIEGDWLLGIDASQGCLCGALHAEVIEPIALGLQVVGDIPEAFSAGKLADQHGEELAPAVKGTEFLSGMMSCGKRVEFISRTKQPPTRSRWVCTSRTESPAIPAAAGLFYVKTIIGVFFKMMCQIFLNHCFRQFSGGNAEISSRPEMTAPVPFLYHRKFLENFSSNPPLDSSHDVSGRDIGWCRNQDVDMILADDTSQNLNLELLTYLPNQFAHPQGEVSLKHMVAVLGYPNKMVLNLEFCMTALAIIHAADYKPTASRMLPA